MRAPTAGLLSLLPLAAAAQPAAPLPADCTPSPSATASMPLALDLAGRPGVPPGLGGYVFGEARVAPYGTLCGAAAPALPADVLSGDGAAPDVLRGPGAGDLLDGARTGTVSVTLP